MLAFYSPHWKGLCHLFSVFSLLTTQDSTFPPAADGLLAPHCASSKAPLSSSPHPHRPWHPTRKNPKLPECSYNQRASHFVWRGAATPPFVSPVPPAASGKRRLMDLQSSWARTSLGVQCKDFPGGLVVKSPQISLLGMQVRSLLRKLRSHMSHSKKRKKKRKENCLNWIKTKIQHINLKSYMGKGTIGAFQVRRLVKNLSANTGNLRDASLIPSPPTTHGPCWFRPSSRSEWIWSVGGGWFDFFFCFAFSSDRSEQGDRERLLSLGVSCWIQRLSPLHFRWNRENVKAQCPLIQV